ncbi:hypothetical protein ES703_103146 [subsurface metagenome]
MAIPILAIIGGVMVVQGLATSALHVFPPLWAAWQKKAFSMMPNVNPQIAELADMRWKELISETEYLQKCQEFGYDNTTAQNLYTSSQSLLSIHDYIALWRRGELDEVTLDTYLRKVHLSDLEIELAKTVTLFFPAVPDLIRFAVREVYTPDIISKFGAMEDLPAKYLTEASKAGLTEEHAKNYWAAHWELPSVRMGYQMLHRRIINDDQLKLLMRALDIMPFWRDPLIKLSYNPLTRVDVRRMYRFGVLDEEGVKNAYLDVGYSDENADKMLDFTVAYEADEMAGITRAGVISAYKKGVITLDQLRVYMESFGYSEEVIDFWVSMAEYDKAIAEIDVLVKEIENRYLLGMLTIKEVSNELNKYDLPASYIAEVITSLKLKESKKIKLPTKADLENWIELQLINENEYYKRMSMLGYTQTDIEIYLSRIAHEKDTEKPKYLPLKTYQRWFSTGIVAEARFRTLLKEQGYSDRDITTLITEIKGKMEVIEE